MTDEPFATYTPGSAHGLREMLADIEQGQANTMTQGVRRVLVDVTGLAAEPGEVGNLLLSHHVGEHLQHLDRIAIVVKHRTGDGERVAQRLGASMRVFTSAAEAAEWLREGQA